MNRRTLLAVVILALASFLVGCGPPWMVVAQAAPNPFVGQRRFAVLPMDYTGLRVGGKSEAEYLAGKDEEQRQSFAGDKAGANETFTRALLSRSLEEGIAVVLATGPADAPFVIRPRVTFFEPGFYVGVASEPSQVNLTILITLPDGRVLDEFSMTHHTEGSLFGASISSGGRLRADGEWLGKEAAEYIIARVIPQ